MSDPSQIQLEDVLPLVYDELKNLASKAMARERQGHSFQTTELVHETYMRLAQLEKFDWNDQGQVMRAAVGIMRRVLIDYARKHNAIKRNPNQLFLCAPNSGFKEDTTPTLSIDLLALDEALDKLRELDSRKAEIIELRYFGGQSMETIAKLLKVSHGTVKRDWSLAKAWMYRELNQESLQG